MRDAADARHRERSERAFIEGALAALIILAGGPGVAHAEAHRTRLEWTRGEGAEGCIDADALQRLVEARLGRAVFSEEAPLLVHGAISREAGRFHVEVELVYEGQRIGLRTLDSERARCRSLDDSLAVIVALLVEASDDMIADAAPVVAAETPQPVEEPATVALHIPEEPTPEAPSSALPLVLTMGLGAWGAIDALPDPALGIYGLVELRLQPWSLRLEGAYVPEQTRTLEANRAASLGLAWGGLALCVDTPITEFWEAGGCLHVRAGALSGRGMGFDESASGTIPWLAASASAHTRVRIIGPLAIALDVGLDVPLLRQRFVIDSGGATQVLHTLPVIAPFMVLQLLVVAE